MDIQIDQSDFIGSCTTKVKGPITKICKNFDKRGKGTNKKNVKLIELTKS